SVTSTFGSLMVDTVVCDTVAQVTGLAANQRYFWRVCGINQYGSSDYSAVASFMTGDYFSRIDGLATGRTDFALLQNYPNPFNPETTIEFAVARECLVQLRVYNLLGQEVATLVNSWLPAGRYRVRASSQELRPGIYFYKMTAGNFSKTRRMVVLE
ncbi:MAG: T9SS type A sorting domain-containing protein, partial [Calditrichaeota bacterium]|nr:T9SS type A sorting domain-containing protein [Calditrichota bacterium]